MNCNLLIANHKSDLYITHNIVKDHYTISN